MSERRQIIVIADDFTGAAEIGGIGLRHGLKVAIEPEPVFEKDADLLVIATDTRSLSPGEAAKRMAEVSKKVMEFQPRLVYKKVDSVLRGNISEELEAQMLAMKKERAVIIAANPVFKRIIREGRYYIDDIPLHETGFSEDHQHPITSNKVLEILKPTNHFQLKSLNINEDLPETGLIMGNVSSQEDLKGWANKFDNRTLLAGASGFFNALLNNLDLNKERLESNIPVFGKRALFVLGSAYPKDTEILKKMEEHGHILSNMPASVYYEQGSAEVDFHNWVHEIVATIKLHQKVITSSMHNNIKDPAIFLRIKKIMARMVSEVLRQVQINEILIEGGSTASEILNELNIKKLIPVQELSVGVIRMKVEEKEALYLTTKPGSYCWPENVWKKEKIEEMNKIKQMNMASYG